MAETGNKKVIFVTITMGGGGSERAISILAEHFVKMGLQVTILMIAGNDIAYQLNEKIEVRQVGNSSNGSLKERLKRISSMRKVFRDNKNANIIAMGTVASIFTLLADFGLTNNVIISERNNPNRINGKPYSKKMKMIRDFLYKRADYCVFQTEDAKDYFPNFPKEKARVIPNSISPDMPSPYEGERTKEIVTAGRLIPEKNQKMLLSAFAEFLRTHQEYALRIFGSGELEQELKQYAKELGIESKTEFIPFTSRLHDEMKKSGIYVSTSNGEGISNAILEAMAMGIPTIATDCPIGGSKMCIDTGNNGILIPVGDVNALVEALNKIAGDGQYAKRLSQNAVLVRERFSEENIVKMWEELLE
ncbi:MAG: glycosyltransferase [Lachnospiraceae bacterium]|nr:glycosyltransferase [Lachnospiraceae bacterium]